MRQLELIQHRAKWQSTNVECCQYCTSLDKPLTLSPLTATATAIAMLLRRALHSECTLVARSWLHSSTRLLSARCTRVRIPCMSMSSISVPTADIIHGPVTHAAPQLYGRPPKSGSQADSLSFHLVYDDIPVPMRDNVDLMGDLYIPSVNNTLDTSRKWPCVLIRTPYNKDKINPDLRNPGVYWTQNGYCQPHSPTLTRSQPLAPLHHCSQLLWCVVVM